MDQKMRRIKMDRLIKILNVDSPKGEKREREKFYKKRRK